MRGLQGEKICLDHVLGLSLRFQLECQQIHAPLKEEGTVPMGGFLCIALGILGHLTLGHLNVPGTLRKVP